MHIRLRPVGMLTDVHNWLQHFLMTSKVCKGYKMRDTRLGVLLFATVSYDIYGNAFLETVGAAIGRPAAPGYVFAMAWARL